ncbi:MULTISPECIES: GntR family transcriptional regulator [Streptomyces]|uniref:GntR family transcriptional regulator n=1 Tax=Streptomyces TaxID=1883 RepID=UPI0002D71297|nr:MULTISPECIES: GntR family transcriptional regulator [Streptomyces]MCC3653557.1 GntR family transcriptional regulator [Streptomyces sp. S07_1.15]MZE77840.1 FCD domain-containing protein [Streptomyces sp. SID5475]WSQ71909.1 GntR family transcriptional regulator [Streptomyces xinghaiensis]
MAPDAALRLSTVSVVEALAASLRDRVLDGRIAPGTALAETEIAAEYAVSRPTARSAVTALVHEGLLHREANKAAYVPQLTRADVEDLFLVRTPLETAVVRLLVERGTVPPAAAGRAIADLGQLEDDAPHSAFVESDLRFHQSLVEAVGSPRLSRLYRGIQGEVHLSMVQTRHALGRERIIAEHTAVLDALRAGDADEAVRTMRAHLEGACHALRAVAGGSAR